MISIRSMMNVENFGNQMKKDNGGELDYERFLEMDNVPMFIPSNPSPTCVSPTDNCGVNNVPKICQGKSILGVPPAIDSGDNETKNLIEPLCKSHGDECPQHCQQIRVQFNLPDDIPKFNHGTDNGIKRKYRRRNSATAAMIMAQGYIRSEQSGEQNNTCDCDPHNGKDFRTRNKDTTVMNDSACQYYERRKSATAALKQLQEFELRFPTIGENGRRFKRRNSATAAMMMAQGQVESSERHVERRCSVTAAMVNLEDFDFQFPPIGENGRRFKRRNSATAAMIAAQGQAEDITRRVERRYSATASIKPTQQAFDFQFPPIGENGRRFKRRNSATAHMLLSGLERDLKRVSPTILENELV